MGTRINLKDIKSTDQSRYANLNEEILEVKSSISSLNTSKEQTESKVESLENTVNDLSDNVSELEEKVDNIVINVDTVKEVVDARGGFDNLDERLDHLESLDIYKHDTNATTHRTYTYNEEGYILKESIRGDMNYDIVYEYDDETGNLLSEKVYVDGKLIGHKNYVYDNDGLITDIIADNADILQIVSTKQLEEVLGQRIKALEDIRIEQELDSIKAQILMGRYDGTELLKQIDNFSLRLQVVESIMPTEVYEIMDIPGIISRLNNLENMLINGKKTYEFIYKSGTIEYSLPEQTDARTLKVYVEGIYLESEDDYKLLNDKQTVRINVALIDGYKIICEYY